MMSETHEAGHMDDNPEFPEGHTGFWMGTEHGTVHVLGDPNMSEKTARLIGEMVKAAHKMMDKKEEPNHD
jgi:hypothetical protein